MIDDNVKEIAKEVIQTQPPNRPWVLSLIINVLLFAAVLYCISREKKAIEEKIQAERKYEILVNNNINDNKAANSAIVSAVIECNKEWQKKYDDLLQKSSKEYNEVTEKRIEELLEETRRIKNQAKRLNERIK